MLCPHLLSAQLVVVHWTSAMRSWHSLLLVGVHLSGTNIVVVVGIWIGVVVLLVAWQTIVRRLPACHSIRDVRAVAAAGGLLLAIVGCGFQDLRWIVPGGWIRGKGRSLLLPVGWQRILSWRLGSRRGLHPGSKMRWYSSHASVHSIHVVVRGLSLQRWCAVYAIRWRNGSARV